MTTFDIDDLDAGLTAAEREDYEQCRQELAEAKAANSHLRYNLSLRERHLADVLSSLEDLTNNLHLLVHARPRGASEGAERPRRATRPPMRAG